MEIIGYPIIADGILFEYNSIELIRDDDSILISCQGYDILINEKMPATSSIFANSLLQSVRKTQLLF